MYYYYFRRVLGWPVWWKSYVTKFQIVQFTVSVREIQASLHGTLGGPPDFCTGISLEHLCRAWWPSAPCFTRNAFYAHLCSTLCQALCYLVTLALLSSGEQCAGARVLVFNFVFNMTLLYQFFGVMRQGRKKTRGD
eukprot:6201260-Pleurochrysis_carterae.AAC.1